MAATIAAVYPHMNHIGGDGFWLIREPSGPRARADGRGAGRGQGDAAVLSRCGHDEIPTRGPLAALTVPGAVGDLAAGAGGGASAAAASCRSTCCSTPAISVHARAMS